MRDIFRRRRMWRPRPPSRTPTTSSSSAAARTAWPPPTTCASAGSPTSPCWRRATSARARPGATRRSCARTTRRPRARASTTRAIKLYEGLSRELNFNLLFSQCGHLTLAHSDRAMFVMANRAEVNRLQGIDSRLIGPDEVKRLAPAMHVSQDATYPIMGALYHPPGGIIRHDAVVWGLARGADAGGAEIHPYTEVLGLRAQQRARRRGAHQPRHDPRGAGGQLPPRAGARCCATWRAWRCRSPPTSCRPA